MEGGRKTRKEMPGMPMFIQRSIEVEAVHRSAACIKVAQLLLENQNTPSPPERSNSRSTRLSLNFIPKLNSSFSLDTIRRNWRLHNEIALIKSEEKTALQQQDVCRIPKEDFSFLKELGRKRSSCFLE